MTGPILLLTLGMAGPAQEEPPVFGVEVEVVRIEVLVTDDGRPVRGLVADDFEVRDNGVSQTLHPVTLEKAPVDALLVLDISGSVIGSRLEALQGAAEAFLDGLDEGDRAALIGFQHSVTVALPLGSDFAHVRFALETAGGGGRTALHDAVYLALRLPEPGSRRVAVLVFSDGIDNMIWLSARNVVEAARRSDAVVYAVDARGPGDPRDAFLDDVTRATGGQAWSARGLEELRDRFLDVLKDIRARYLLTYTPSGVDTVGRHVLEVKLREGRRGDVLARPAYYRPPATPPAGGSDQGASTSSGGSRGSRRGAWGRASGW